MMTLINNYAIDNLEMCIELLYILCLKCWVTVQRQTHQYLAQSTKKQTKYKTI